MNYRKLERIIKGVANHRRIEILVLLNRKPELSVEEISDRLNVNFKTIAAHVGKLAASGMIMKRNDINFVRHNLTSRGQTTLKFFRIIE